jgi:hypothetical protein
MFETIAAVERKTIRTVMGAKTSRLSLDNPFPVESKVSRDLDLLSLVVARILNTPDIYDINNLARPGVCGDYAVLLKEQVEKRLLPFIADVSGKKMKVVYQNPTKLIKDAATRKEICSQLTDSALRVASIVLACLASIQVAGQSRETAIASVVKQSRTALQQPIQQLLQQPVRPNPFPAVYPQIQRGGGIQDIRDWFVENGYLRQEDATRTVGAMRTPVPLISSGRSNHIFKVAFWSSGSIITLIKLSVESTDTSDPMPSGSLDLQVINPITIPGTTQTVLPILILDVGGAPWMVGVLYKNVYKSLDPGIAHASPFSVWHNIFRKTQTGHVAPLLESNVDRLKESYAVFQQAKDSGRPEPILQRISQFLSEHVSGYTAFAAPAYPPPYGAPAYPPPYGAPAYPQPYGAPAYPQPYGVQQVRPLQPFGSLSSLAPRLGAELQAGIDYVIPMQATRGILTTISGFRDLFVAKSCPAAVRATTLSAQVNSDRTITTAVCSDPYWIDTNMSKIFPYATLQFLCTKEWKAVSTPNNFTDEWAQFTSGLKSIYGDKLSGNGTLDQLVFKNPQPEDLCGPPTARKQNPRVAFQKVQNTLLSIQGEYARHVAGIWQILNDLILVVVDPDTKEEVVRLHPKVSDSLSGKSSLAYVSDRASMARKLISAHYLTIENVYYTTVRELKAL